MLRKIHNVPEQKNIALVAHDNKKQELSEWVLSHKGILEEHKLLATGTTGGY